MKIIDRKKTYKTSYHKISRVLLKEQSRWSKLADFLNWLVIKSFYSRLLQSDRTPNHKTQTPKYLLGTPETRRRGRRTLNARRAFTSKLLTFIVDKTVLIILKWRGKKNYNPCWNQLISHLCSPLHRPLLKLHVHIIPPKHLVAFNFTYRVQYWCCLVQSYQTRLKSCNFAQL